MTIASRSVRSPGASWAPTAWCSARCSGRATTCECRCACSTWRLAAVSVREGIQRERRPTRACMPTRSPTRSTSSSGGCGASRARSWRSCRIANRERLDGTVENREVKEIYIADYDGANQRRVTVSRQLNINPSWSPDARPWPTRRTVRIPDVFISRIYEGVLQNPTKGIGTNYLPVFSPDGKQIAFMSARDGNPEIYA